MKSFKYFIISFLLLTLFSCSKTDEKKERFISTYKEILIVRERFTDSVKAKTEIKKIYSRYKYSEITFFEEWKNYSAKPDEFIIIMDTIRKRAEAELSKYKVIE